MRSGTYSTADEVSIDMEELQALRPHSPLLDNLFEQVPNEILLNIILFLHPKDIHVLSKTDHRFHQICHEQLWVSDEPAFKHWRAGFFRRRQDDLYFDIDQFSSDKSSYKTGIGPVFAIGLVLTAISGYILDIALDQPSSRDFKIVCGVMVLMSAALLLASIGMVLRNCYLEVKTHQAFREIDHLNHRIQNEYAP